MSFFSVQNTTAIPNAVFDHILPTLGHAELKCYLYLLRHTLGYGKTSDAVALSQFKGGIVRGDGSQQDAGTGLGVAAIMAGLRGLEERGLIGVARHSGKGQRTATNTYSLNMTLLTDETEQNRNESQPILQSRNDSPNGAESRIASRVTKESRIERKKEATVPVVSDSSIVLYPILPSGVTQSRENQPKQVDTALITVEPQREFEMWWLAAIAQHARQRPRACLSDGDSQTLARWRNAGTTDARLIGIVSEMLDTDSDRHAFALAYFDHRVRRQLQPRRKDFVQTDRLQRAAPQSSAVFVCDAAPPPDRPPHKVESRLKRCDVCATVFILPDNDPCLQRMSAIDQRKWAATHIASHHYPYATSAA